MQQHERNQCMRRPSACSESVEEVSPGAADVADAPEHQRRVRPRGPPPPPGAPVHDDGEVDDAIESADSSSSTSTEVPSVVSLELMGPLLDRAKTRVLTLFREELNATTPWDSTRRIAGRLGWAKRDLKNRDWTCTKWKAQQILSGTRLQKWNDYVEEEGHTPRDE